MYAFTKLMRSSNIFNKIFYKNNLRINTILTVNFMIRLQFFFFSFVIFIDP